MANCLKQTVKGYHVKFITYELLISDCIQGTEINICLAHKEMSRKLLNEVYFSSLIKRGEKL